MNMIRFGPEKGFNSIVHQAVGNGIYNRPPGCFLKNMISNYAVQLIKIFSILIKTVQGLINNSIGFKPTAYRMPAGSQDKTI